MKISLDKYSVVRFEKIVYRFNHGFVNIIDNVLKDLTTLSVEELTSVQGMIIKLKRDREKTRIS